MRTPLLSVLIAGIPGRQGEQLASKIRGQVHSQEVEVLAQIDEQLSGPTRNDLTAAANGKYIAFVDDDDDVNDQYVAAMLSGCRSNADVVTMKLQFRNQRVREQWQFALVAKNLREHGIMMANHLCAWKRSLATQVAWCPELGNYDDHLWFEPLYHAGVVHTQFYINTVLYYYNYVQEQTENQKSHAIAKRRRYVGRGLRCWKDRRHGILVEVPGGLARDRHNQLHSPPDKKPFHIIK